MKVSAITDRQTDRQTVAIRYFIAAGFDESVGHHLYLAAVT